MLRNECRFANLGFSTLHLNIRSIYQNRSRFTDLLYGLDIKFSAIGITETLLQDVEHMVDIEGYNFIHNHRQNRIGGGVGLYLSDKFINRILCIEVINPQGKNTVVGIVYRPPDQNLNIFVDDFRKISREKKLGVIMGGFNINFMNHQCHNKTGELVNSIFSNMLLPSYYSPN